METYLDSLGLATQENLKKITNGYYDNVILEQRRAAQQAGIKRTPSIVYNGGLLRNYGDIGRCLESN